MPYRSIADLPPRIREHLPPHAQEIFLVVQPCVGGVRFAIEALFRLVDRGDGKQGGVGVR